MTDKVRRIVAMMALVACLSFSVSAVSAETGTDRSSSTEAALLEETVSIEEVTANYNDAVVINLSDNGITVNGSVVTGDESAAVYTANDIIYYIFLLSRHLIVDGQQSE